MTYETEIYQILKNKTEELLKTMGEDFQEKYTNKRNNWMLEGFEKEIIKYLAFVSSFESKHGTMFENITKDIAKLKYGEENVPETIKGAGVTDEEYEIKSKELIEKNKTYKNPKQYIITKYDKDKNDKIMTEFRSSRVGSGRRPHRIPSSLTQSELPKLLEENLDYDGEIYGQEVDLMIFDPDNEKYKLFEIKAGGNLDNSSAPKNIEKLLKIYSCIGNENSEIYFATLYNKDGEGHTWNTSVTRHISDECLLIGKDFWEVILKDITFPQFKEIHKNVINDTSFNDKINNLKNTITTLDDF